MRPDQPGSSAPMANDGGPAPGAPPDYRLIVLANRAPFRAERAADGRLSVRRSASGVVTALEPLVASRAGTWVACGSEGDAIDTDGGTPREMPIVDDRYRLRLVPLAADEHRGYYYGFANEGLWALCHAVGTPPTFREEDFVRYRSANAKFASAVAEHATGGPAVVFVQDYHFALAPLMLRLGLPAVGDDEDFCQWRGGRHELSRSWRSRAC